MTALAGTASERIELAESPHTLHRWWVRGELGDLGHAVIGLGQIETGQWFATRAARGWSRAWAARAERQACDAVQSWINRRGGIAAWQEVTPAGEACGAAPPDQPPRARD